MKYFICTEGISFIFFPYMVSWTLSRAHFICRWIVKMRKKEHTIKNLLIKVYSPLYKLQLNEIREQNPSVDISIISPHCYTHPHLICNSKDMYGICCPQSNCAIVFERRKEIHQHIQSVPPSQQQLLAIPQYLSSRCSQQQTSWSKEQEEYVSSIISIR